MSAVVRRDTRYVEYQGKRWPIADLARELGVRHPLLYARVVTQGMSVEQALAKPVRNVRRNGCGRRAAYFTS
jgi:hypothetical protein